MPIWVAWIVHCPVVNSDTVYGGPATVQTPVVVELKLTARFDVDVALIENAGVPSATPGSEPNVIVCDALFTVKVRGTSVAAR